FRSCRGPGAFRRIRARKRGSAQPQAPAAGSPPAGSRGGRRDRPSNRARDVASTGDGELYGRALKIAIRGLYPPGAFEAKRREFLPLAADLEVIFPSFDPIDATPNRFQAWSFRRAGGWNPSPPIRFSFEHAAESPLERA